MKYIEGTDKKYAITKEGEVVSFRRNAKGRTLKSMKTRHGYAYATILINGKMESKLIHHLVARTFLGEPEPGKFVLHKNDDRLDNNVDNLYYGTKKDNAVDTVVNGNHGQAALTMEEVSAIRMDLRHTHYKEVAEKYGVSPGIVYNILRGATWAYIGDLSLTDEQRSIHKLREPLYELELAKTVREYYCENRELSVGVVGEHFGLKCSTARRMIRGTGRYSKLGNIPSAKPWKSTRINYEISQQILADYKNGMKTMKLAEKYDADPSSISRLIRGNYKYAKPKVETAENTVLLVSRNRKLYAKHVAAIREAYKGGMTPKEIAKRRKISDRAVRRILRGEFCGGTDLLPRYEGSQNNLGEGKYYSRGESHINSKLTDESVEFIRRTHRRGEYSQIELAEMFNVSGPVIYYANTGVTWSHV